MKKALLQTATAVILSITSIVSIAADSPKQTLAKQLSEIQITTYDTTSNFLSYTLEDNKIPYAATQYSADNKAASTHGNTLATSIDSAVASLAIKGAKPIQPLWVAYEHILNNEQLPLVAPGGLLDTFNIQELVKARNALIVELDVIRKEAETESSPIDIMALNQARRVKEIAMTYTARISPEQGTMMAIDPKFDLKIEAQKISTGFDDLLSVAAGNPAQLKIINEAKTDWLFLTPVFSSDRKVQASSVVTIYSANIAKLLEQL
jgi:hypothetical protein